MILFSIFKMINSIFGSYYLLYILIEVQKQFLLVNMRVFINVLDVILTSSGSQLTSDCMTSTSSPEFVGNVWPSSTALLTTGDSLLNCDIRTIIDNIEYQQIAGCSASTGEKPSLLFPFLYRFGRSDIFCRFSAVSRPPVLP